MEVLEFNYFPVFDDITIFWLIYSTAKIQSSDIHLNRGILGMTIYSIWWLDSRSGELRSLEYPFSAITLKYTVVQSGCIY